jgi:hypothetical protein
MVNIGVNYVDYVDYTYDHTTQTPEVGSDAFIAESK